MRRPVRSRRPLRAAGALLLVPLAACGGGDDGETLTVLAAASLTDVYERLATGFEEEQGVEVEFSFGSSTGLAEQAADGAPGDVLATADSTSMQVADAAGVAGDPVTFATNVMVIVTPPDNPAGIQGLDDLADVAWVRCADEVPCGRVALSVLDAGDVTADPVSLEEDVRATLDKVVSGEAEAGLVYATDAVAAGDDVATVEIAGAEEQRTSYVAATLEGADEPELAQDWVDLLTSETGQQALTDAGFTVP